MTDLFNGIISSPIYCFDVSRNFKKMFGRLCPMLEGSNGAAGVPENGTLKMPYLPRYALKQCILILWAGTGVTICSGAKHRVRRNLKTNSFYNMGTVVIEESTIRKRLNLQKSRR